MAGLRERIWSFLIGQDRALNSLGGGKLEETISGTCGRALAEGKWWARPACWALDAIFGQGHCAEQAAREADRL
ncbi:MAG TPA: hypothetical protein VJ775_05970 [Sphingomicrobium sp.]|nr:hypothetical protein [Sphingomicrobium sp.]